MRHTRALRVALVGAIVVLLLSCGLGAEGVRHGFVAPPEIRLAFGSVRLVSSLSTLPDCARLLTPGCRSLHPEPVVMVYTLWLLRQRNAGSWSNPQIIQLFKTQIRPL